MNKFKEGKIKGKCEALHEVRLLCYDMEIKKNTFTYCNLLSELVKKYNDYAKEWNNCVE